MIVSYAKKTIDLNASNESWNALLGSNSSLSSSSTSVGVAPAAAANLVDQVEFESQLQSTTELLHALGKETNNNIIFCSIY